MSDWDDRLNFAGIGAQIAAAAERAALLGAQHVLAESTKVVPIEEGTLSRSGTATAETQGTAAVGAISYDGPYAVRQHEELGYRHDQGRQAKYLEGPLTASAQVVAQIAATEARKALS
jgi:hypothetical protein